MLNISVLKTFREMVPIARDYKIWKTVDFTLISEWVGKAILEIICLLLLMALMVRLFTAHFTLHALPWHAYYSILRIYVYFHGIYLRFPFPITTVKNWQIQLKKLPLLVLKICIISFTDFVPLMLLIHFFSVQITHSETFFTVMPALKDTFKS